MATEELSQEQVKALCAQMGKGVKLPRRSKFGAKKVEVDGRIFDSGREAGVYQRLKMLEQSGHIRHLECQVEYDLEVNGVHIAFYRADFRYLEGDSLVIVDAKGVRTDSYKMKRSLMLGCHGVRIVEM